MRPKQVWVGLLGVEPVAGCGILGGDNVVGAYVYFLVAAQSDDEFRAIATDLAKQLKLYVHDFDEVMPWKDWSKRAAKVDAYLSERAKETLDDGQPRFGEFHRYLERDETTS